MIDRRIVVVGDIHGCLDEFEELLLDLEYNARYDRLILAGDLLDRGPDPVGVLRKVQEMKVECVLGNHEEKHLRWHKHEVSRKANGKKNPMKSLNSKALEEHNKLTDKDFDFIAGLPLYIKIGDWVVVHAGFEPGIPLEAQERNACMRIRYVGENNRFSPGVLPANDSVVHWSERWNGPFNVVYGHYIHDFERPKVTTKKLEQDEDNRVKTIQTQGIDTGCCFGGYLTAYILGSFPQTYVQVKAKKEYLKWRVKEQATSQ